MTDETRNAIETAVGNLSLTADELADPDTTADGWLALMQELEGTPGWDQPLTFTADELADWIYEKAVTSHD